MIAIPMRRAVLLLICSMAYPLQLRAGTDFDALNAHERALSSTISADTATSLAGAPLSVVIVTALASGALLMLATLAFCLMYMLREPGLRWFAGVSAALVLYPLVLLAEAQIAAIVGAWFVVRGPLLFEGLFLAALVVLAAHALAGSLARSALSQGARWLGLGLLLLSLGALLLPVAHLAALNTLVLLVTLFALLGLVVLSVRRHTPASVLLALMLAPVIIATGLRLHELVIWHAAGSVPPLLMLVSVALFGAAAMLVIAANRQRALRARWAAARTKALRLESEQARCKQALAETGQRAEVAEKVRRDFLSMINHEFRGPLASIAGLSGLLREEFEWSKGLHRNFHSLEHYAQCLLQILDEAVAYERGETARVPLVSAPVDLEQFLAGLSELGDWLAGRHAGSFSIQVDDQLPHLVMLDERAVRQILLSLLLNAWQHANCRKACMRVGVHRDVESKSLQFVVQNDGKPLVEPEFTQMLQAYKAGLTSKGLGLGLALAARLAREMGGSLQVMQSDGVSGISLTLPLPTTEPAQDEFMAISKRPHSQARSCSVSPEQIKLSATDAAQLGLQELKDLIETGQLSAIEDWLSDKQGIKNLTEQARRYVGAIDAALARLDLYGLERLSKVAVSDVVSSSAD